MDYVNAAVLGVVLVVLFLLWERPKLGHIPTLGYSAPLLSYFTAFKFRSQSREMIEEGYRKFPNQIWKLSTLDGWFIVANGTQRVEEMNKASGKELSAILNFQSYLQLDYTLGPEVTTNPYHINVVRSTMTRNVAAQFDDMRTEAISAFEDLIPSTSTEAHAIPIFSSIAEVISRINARLAVGFPLCQNKTFRDLCGRSSTVLFRGRHLRFVPTFLRPIATKLIVNSSADIGAMANHLQPLVADRLSQQRLHGFEWPGKPNDTLMWTMDEAQKSGEEVTAYGMATRLYFLTFASDGIAMMLSCALYEVATRPEYIKPLRDEVESVVGQEGWSKDSISKLYKMDSFFREVHRCYDLNILHLGRRAVKDFIFSDGTLIPAGSDIFSNAYGIHYDEKLYPSAHAFDGFRYVQEDAAKQAQFTKPGLDYVPFGYGKHACPGRFTAAYQMKTMLAYLIATYDIETDKALHPMNGFLEKAFSANLEAKVTFKRRR
ncbi:cytochrome P450 [Pholiota conissans]|uniref:Cytochrome P450 n=1 Tax=Pholiota conissans TaxID=109636 RepID=A0A9P6CZN1_9AGAR|nr:cytochrome P450 [Pholiota conissans]